MAAEKREGNIGTYQYKKTGGLTFGEFVGATAALGTAGAYGLAANQYSKSSGGGSYKGTLLDFNVDFQGKNVSGTYNPSQGGGGSTPVTQNKEFVNSTFNLLNTASAISLGEAQTASKGNTSDNPFFGEFFNYYLGLAQDRQANLQKSVGRKDLLTGGDAASLLGGTLI